MVWVEMRHSGISHDIKAELEIIPRIGDIVDFMDGEDHHLFKVEKIVHIYENHKFDKLHISGKKLSNWLG